jgi:hypothetical protein
MNNEQAYLRVEIAPFEFADALFHHGKDSYEALEQFIQLRVGSFCEPLFDASKRSCLWNFPLLVPAEQKDKVNDARKIVFGCAMDKREAERIAQLIRDGIVSEIGIEQCNADIFKFSAKTSADRVKIDVVQREYFSAVPAKLTFSEPTAKRAPHITKEAYEAQYKKLYRKRLSDAKEAAYRKIDLAVEEVGVIKLGSLLPCRERILLAFGKSKPKEIFENVQAIAKNMTDHELVHSARYFWKDSNRTLCEHIMLKEIKERGLLFGEAGLPNFQYLVGDERFYLIDVLDEFGESGMIETVSLRKANRLLPLWQIQQTQQLAEELEKRYGYNGGRLVDCALAA